VGRVVYRRSHSACKQRQGLAEGKGVPDDLQTHSDLPVSELPRRYRHHYLDRWQERDVRAAMLVGRCLEQAVAALFRHEDPAALWLKWHCLMGHTRISYQNEHTSDTR
jgi:hypothetical protein